MSAAAKRMFLLPRSLRHPEDLPTFAALSEIARERAEKLELLRAAILRADTNEVYRISGSLCGLGDDYEPGHRTNQSH